MSAAAAPPIAFVCPACTAPLSPQLACANCGRTFTQRDGIYRFLLPEREVALTAFLDQYRRVRERDGYRFRGQAAITAPCPARRPETHKQKPGGCETPASWRWCG